MNKCFCTLFDSKYIDKGIALYESLENTCDFFRLYVFAFDDISCNILKSKKFPNMIVISLKEFETDRMLEVKKDRSPGEYCWTCTPITIEYVLNHYDEDMCTYIDADVYFFTSPDLLFEEIRESNDSVIITEHRFAPKEREKRIRESGKYCVQFNTFKKDEHGMKVLQWWKEKCLEWCYYEKSGDRLGDQKYLECWCEKFQGVHELQHIGGGAAPWNIAQYKVIKNNEQVYLSYEKRNYELVFYHFQNIRYLPFNLVNIRCEIKDKKVKEYIYIPYLRHIEDVRKNLKDEYGISFSIKKSYFSNPLLRFIQNYIMPFKIRSFSELINLKRVR